VNELTTREVKPDEPYGCRLGCSLCGGTIEKFEMHGRWTDDEGDGHDVCLYCVDSSDSLLAQRIERYADQRERHAREHVDWLRKIAGDAWLLPSRDEMEDAFAPIG
jgi:hypothetical protein